MPEPSFDSADSADQDVSCATSDSSGMKNIEVCRYSLKLSQAESEKITIVLSSHGHSSRLELAGRLSANLSISVDLESF